ncbi:nucleoside 2-deoxyribosyltransferase [Candidatus Woesearchaeota archaeon CG_4_10_14_0_2_um_filter_33_13]|nr:MAG: nucleoside 2-deoxyribosyltransferase [Candidatus Woesearchaeota archaeon CG_4_10_14_0_2_um_filter_33_13]
MKIYFAGSIRGGREDKELYFKLIESLAEHGQVLTEHIGNSNLGEFGEQHDDKVIYDRDMAWVKEANVIIAEVSTPSLGVGYEIGQAEMMGKKILCLYRNGQNKKLSAMISGNKNIKIVKYDCLNDAITIIDHFFKNIS